MVTVFRTAILASFCLAAVVLTACGVAKCGGVACGACELPAFLTIVASDTGQTPTGVEALGEGWCCAGEPCADFGGVGGDVTCWLTVNAPGTYPVTITAPGYGPVASDIVVEEDPVAGCCSCGYVTARVEITLDPS